MSTCENLGEKSHCFCCAMDGKKQSACAKTQEEKLMKKNILKRIFALVLAMVMALGLTGCATPEGQYNAANKLLIKGEYEKAAEKFEALGSFNDAPQMTRYCRAMAAGENGQYESAVKTFEAMGDFKDCPSLVTYYTARYYEAEGGKETDHLKWYSAEGWKYYEKAYEIYDTLPMFRDSDTRAEACHKAMYDRGVALADGGNYEQAANLMEMMSMEYDEYPDSGEKCQYYAGCYEMQEGNYDLAYGYFIGLEDYMDAPTRAQEALNTLYAKGEECYAEGLYADAYVYFGWLAEYTEYSSEKGAPADRAKESVYLYGEQMLNAETPDYSEARDAFEIAGDFAPEGKAIGTERVKECWYLEGESLLYAEEPDYEAAKAAFENAGDYSDASTRYYAYWYQKGEELLNAETPDYSGARAAFANAGEYVPEGKAVGKERIKERWYLQGLSLKNAETPDYKGAYAAFVNAEDYTAESGDASQLAKETAYLLGEELLYAEEPDYNGAKLAFKNAGDYSDAATRYYAYWYQKGEELLYAETPDYDGAREAFANAEKYAPEGKNAGTERIKECWYLQGESLLYAEEPDYEAAKTAFENAGDYSDASTRYYAYWYQLGLDLMNGEKPDYKGAYDAFVNAEDYSAESGDASQLAKEASYLYGEALLSAGKPAHSAAKTAFENAGDYKDASTRYYAYWYQKGEEELAKKEPDFLVAQKAFKSAETYMDAEEKYVLCELQIIKKAKVGSKVSFGDRKWYVIKKTGSKVFLMSEKPIPGGFGDNVWETSGQREYLNSAFLDACFSNKEQKCIVVTKVPNARNKVGKGGRTTEDRVFIFSQGEAKTYSKYLIQACTLENGKYDRVWLRTPAPGGNGEYQMWTFGLKTTGEIWFKSNMTYANGGSIVPVMWIDTNTFSLK